MMTMQPSLTTMKTVTACEQALHLRHQSNPTAPGPFPHPGANPRALAWDIMAAKCPTVGTKLEGKYFLHSKCHQVYIKENKEAHICRIYFKQSQCISEMHYMGPLISVFGVFSVFYFIIPLSHRILDPRRTMKTSILQECPTSFWLKDIIILGNQKVMN